jgi:hypothetical protein
MIPFSLRAFHRFAVFVPSPYMIDCFFSVAYFSTLKMEAVVCSETLNIYRTKLYVPTTARRDSTSLDS